jgi:hypothetical protein
MINAVFDDENATTRGNWAYPDTGAWDPDRNTDEFAAAVPAYAQRGLRAVTVGLQGGRPKPDTSQTWKVSAFASDGSLKPAWFERLDRVIRACDANRMVVIVSLFYKAQDQRLQDEAAVVRAVDLTTDWLLAGGYTNVLVEIGNETNDVGWDHPILTLSRIDDLIARVQSRSGGRLLVSTSFGGGYIPPDNVVQASDFVLVHGNSQSASGVGSMVDKILAKSAYAADPKPIVFNEDSTQLANLDAAVERGASWGYHDRGTNNYVDGFQSVPVNWTINTATKKGFFDRVAALAGASTEQPPAPPPPPPPPPPPAAVDAGVALSQTPDRSASTSLESLKINGAAYVFVPDFPGIAEVRFYLDDPDTNGVPKKIERTAPWDYAGTELDGTAKPWDTTEVVDGTHAITAEILLTAGATKTVSASFDVANNAGASAAAKILVSRSSDRASPVTLAGATIGGSVYVFAEPASETTRMRFYLDDPMLAGTAFTTESNPPYDFAGSVSSGAPRPFDTTTVADGPHTITVVVERADGTVDAASASFSVDN